MPPEGTPTRALDCTATAVATAIRAAQDNASRTHHDNSKLTDEVIDSIAELDLAPDFDLDVALEHRDAFTSKVIKATGLLKGRDDKLITEAHKTITELIAEAKIREAWKRIQRQRKEEAKKRAAAEQALATDTSRLVLGERIGDLVRHMRLGKRPAGKGDEPEVRYSQRFEYGEVRFLDATVDIPVPCTYYAADIFVAAIKCFDSEDPTSDEPYLLMSVVNPTPIACGDFSGSAMTWNSGITEGIGDDEDEKDLFGLNLLAFKDVAIGEHGISIKLALIDHEHGSAESVRRDLQKQAERAANSIQGLIEMAGVNVDEAIEKQKLEDNLLDTFYDVTLEAFTDLLADDLIDEKVWKIPARVMRDWVDKDTLKTSGVTYPPTELPSHIDTNFPYENIHDQSWIFSGGGGNYKVYLLVLPKRIERVYMK